MKRTLPSNIFRFASSRCISWKNGAVLFAATILFSLASCRPTPQLPTNKKEIMDAFLAGTLPESYVPAAFFIHHGGHQTFGDPAIQAHLQYFLQTNMDILKVQFEQRVPSIHWHDGATAWDSIAPLPEDFYQPTLDVIRGLYEVAGQDVYILPTIYSPFQVATQSLGESGLREGAQHHPEALCQLMGYYADALRWLVRECKSMGIEGFYMTCQGGEMKYYDIPSFYETFVRPYDLDVMNACTDGTHVNILHICDWEGTYDDLTRYVGYPGQIVNTPINLNGTAFTTQDGAALFGRPILGGLDRHGVIVNGTAEETVQAVREALNNAPAGRTMLGAECTVGGAPKANLHAAIYEAHHFARP